MTERLTQELYYTNDPQTWIQKVNNKLGKLEDIMEKYGIESVESLQELLQCLNACFINSANSFKMKFEKLEKDIKYITNRNGKHYEELCEMTKDRDTWKKTCEIAVAKWRKWEELSCGEVEASDEEIAKVIYQQAQKEGKNAERI